MLLRAFNLLLCAAMLAAVAVQYNDPDGPLWMLYYGVPAFWAGLMVWRPSLPQPPGRWRLALWASLAFSAGLMVFYWPPMPGFWRKDVWWVEEAAREGMGLMIAFAVVAAIVAQAMLARRR